MSGRKQHYIPQSLLRGFGKQGKGKAVQVTVYTKDRGVFTTATDGVAAQRYFYSELPADTEVETLDTKITAYEANLTEILAEFRVTTPGQAVDAVKAAEAVTHLCVRQAHLRDSFASTLGQLISGTANVFRDKDRARTAVGLDAQTPNKMLREEIDKLYEQLGPQLRQLGFTRRKFQQFAFAKAKADFDRNFAEQSPFLHSLFHVLQGQADTIARRGHVKALERDLAPDARVEYLKRFAWRIEPGPASGLVLPDCVAISWSAGESYQPLTYAGKDMDAVFMPMCHDRLLVGKRRGVTDGVPETMNEAFAACSWDFFIARDRTPEFQQLVARIGERTRELGDEAVRSAIEKLQYGD